MQTLTTADLPTWTTVGAWVLLAVAVGCAAWTLVDVRRRPPAMGVMAVVWPVTMLFGSLLWLALYLRAGRAAPRAEQEQHDGMQHDEMHHGDSHHDGSQGSGRRPWPTPLQTAVETSHCGAGCTIGDVVGETVAVLAPGVLVAAGLGSLWQDEIFARWTLDLAVALVAGVVLQYFAIVPMQHLSPGRGVLKALQADVLSIAAWQVGMYLVMALVQLLVVPTLADGRLAVTTPQFWVVMQVAMVAGFCTSAPVNAVLVRRGVKVPM